MNTSKRNKLETRPTLLCAAAMVLAIAASPVQAQQTAGSASDDEAEVECRLPPQIRTLGRNATYLAGGRTIRTSIAECKVRGGTYAGQGPGAIAGRGSSEWAARTPVPVIVGGDSSKTACPRDGVVVGLSAKGTLSVRSGPATSSTRIDGVGNGRKVAMCDWSVNGDWVGIVYAAQSGVDCGLSKYLATPQPYSGTCKAGWVSSKYVK